MMVHEPATLLTDCLLATLASWFAWRLQQRMPATNSAARWWSRVLGLTAVSALVGGGYHGFAPNFPAPVAGAWWVVTLVIICLLSAAMAMSLLHELTPPEKHRPWHVFIGCKLAVFAGAAAAHPVFVVTIIDYGLTLLAWAVAALVLRRAWRGWMLAAIALSIIAAFVQQMHWDLSPKFNHNDLFHVTQALALFGFYRAAAVSGRPGFTQPTLAPEPILRKAAAPPRFAASKIRPLKSNRNYPLLLAGQFLSAFGDNAILAVIVGQLTYLQKSGVITATELRTSNTIYTSLLFVPYVLLAPLAGYLNDRYAKTRWLVGGNALKLLGTAVCTLSVWFGPMWQGFGYLVVGIGACFYGPAKYGILPEILPRERLVKANGMVELLTLTAILGGAIAGSVLADVFKDQVLISYCVLTGIFGSALLLNFLMTPTPHKPDIRLAASVAAFGGHLRDLLTSPRLCRILIGTALFWVCGAVMKINFQPWGLEVLHLPDNTQIALLGLWLSVGVMAGSVLAGQLHQVGDLRRTRTYGFALAGMLALLYSVNSFGFWHSPVVHLGPLHLVVPVVLLLVGTGVTAGLFLIPLNAALQSESDPDKLGKTIAVQNLGDNLGMLLAGAYTFASVMVGLSSSGVFLGLAVGVVVIVTWLKLRQYNRFP